MLGTLAPKLQQLNLSFNYRLCFDGFRALSTIMTELKILNIVMASLNTDNILNVMTDENCFPNLCQVELAGPGDSIPIEDHRTIRAIRPNIEFIFVH